MIDHEPQEINENIKKQPDCSQHALCRCLCHEHNVSGPIARHVVACCYQCEVCGQNVIFQGKANEE